MYSISAHKLGGLKGVGALIKRKSLVLPPYVYGGGQERGLRSGTENVFGIMSFAYAAEEKFATIRQDYERIKGYREAFWSALNPEHFDRISAEEGSPYILTLSAKGLRGEIVLHMAEDKGLLIGTGSACSSNSKTRYNKVVLAMGYSEQVADGAIRISFSTDTTAEEVEAAAAILTAVVNELRTRMNVKE